MPQLGGLVKPVLSIGVGETRTVRVDLHNWSGRRSRARVTLTLPAGFSATPRVAAVLRASPPGGDTSVTFDVTNTNTALPTANQGGDGRRLRHAGHDDERRRRRAAETFGLELVPVDGDPAGAGRAGRERRRGRGRVPGPGARPQPAVGGRRRATRPPTARRTAKVAWRGDDLYLLVHVTDDVLGTKVDARPTASGTGGPTRSRSRSTRAAPSENTSTTFKTGIFPTDDRQGPPCFERDADNHQGDAEDRARDAGGVGRVVAPYTGYTLEVKIPLADLPGGRRPGRTSG